MILEAACMEYDPTFVKPCWVPHYFSVYCSGCVLLLTCPETAIFFLNGEIVDSFALPFAFPTLLACFDSADVDHCHENTVWIFVHFQGRGKAPGSTEGGRCVHTSWVLKAPEKRVRPFVLRVFPLALPGLNGSSVNTLCGMWLCQQDLQWVTKCHFSITFYISGSIMSFLW